MPIINRTMRDAADRRVGADFAYWIKFGPFIAAAVLLMAVGFGLVYGVHWLIGHLSTPNVSIPNPNASGVPFGLIAVALVASLAVMLIVRRLVRHFRYGV